jgi:hypothetical protein
MITSKRKGGVYTHAVFNFFEVALSGSLKGRGLPENRVHVFPTHSTHAGYAFENT